MKLTNSKSTDINAKPSLFFCPSELNNEELGVYKYKFRLTNDDVTPGKFRGDDTYIVNLKVITATKEDGTPVKMFLGSGYSYRFTMQANHYKMLLEIMESGVNVLETDLMLTHTCAYKDKNGKRKGKPYDVYIITEVFPGKKKKATDPQQTRNAPATDPQPEQKNLEPETKAVELKEPEPVKVAPIAEKKTGELDMREQKPKHIHMQKLFKELDRVDAGDSKFQTPEDLVEFAIRQTRDFGCDDTRRSAANCFKTLMEWRSKEPNNKYLQEAIEIELQEPKKAPEVTKEELEAAKVDLIDPDLCEELRLEILNESKNRKVGAVKG